MQTSCVRHKQVPNGQHRHQNGTCTNHIAHRNSNLKARLIKIIQQVIKQELTK